MKKGIIISLIVGGLCILQANKASAQCSICTRTAQQMGEKPAKGLNAGILYLAFMPLAIFGFIAWRVWKKNNAEEILDVKD